MSLKILAECINCGVCEPVCPNGAIYEGKEIYEIDPEKCTGCIGHYDESQCVLICPVECIIVDPDNMETDEQQLVKYKRLIASSIV